MNDATLPEQKASPAQRAFAQLRDAMRTRIIGQEALVDRLLIALLADGHLLVEGAPGLAKTTAVKELAARIEGDFHRVQFTPDLLPADLTGTEICGPEDASFVFQRGPLFHNELLADEVNRAPAKVQSALLEAMGERQITLGRTTYKLPPLFLVMATQNPIEQEGTYPLPEAQLDRFLLYVRIDYPTGDAEQAILRIARDEAHRSLEAHGEATEVMWVAAQAIFDARREVLDMHLSQALDRYLVELVLATRTPARYGGDLARWIAFGASPRASIALVSIRARPRMAGWPRLRGAPRHSGYHPRRAPTSGTARIRCRGRWHRPGPRGRRAAVEGGGPESSTGEARGLPGATFSSADLAGLRARAAGLSLNAHRSNRSGRAGTRLSRFRGRGIEYSESRMYLPGDDIRSNRPAATASAVSNRRISRPKPRSEARASSPLTPRSTNLATTSDALTAEMIPPLKRRAATSAPFSSNTIASSADPILKSICSTPNCLFFGRNHIKVWGTLAVCIAARGSASDRGCAAGRSRGCGTLRLL